MFVGKGRPSGDSNDSEKSNGLTNHDRPAMEGGRGRGSKEDRWSDRRPGGRGKSLSPLPSNLYE